MNAQEVWKTWYRSSKITWYSKVQCREEQKLVRREAALERHCEALQRRIEELEGQLKETEEREALRDKLEWGTP